MVEGVKAVVATLASSQKGAEKAKLSAQLVKNITALCQDTLIELQYSLLLLPHHVRSPPVCLCEHANYSNLIWTALPHRPLTSKLSTLNINNPSTTSRTRGARCLAFFRLCIGVVSLITAGQLGLFTDQLFLQLWQRCYHEHPPVSILWSHCFCTVTQNQ
jgi:hypothetical protein